MIDREKCYGVRRRESARSGAILYKIHKVSFSDNMKFEQRPKVGKEATRQI